MRGKYSPTVSAAYAADQEWWDKYNRLTGDFYDPEGYDSYGYDKDGYDRAGNHETDYIASDTEYSDDPFDEGTNFAYDRAVEEWGFDGEKPVIRG